MALASDSEPGVNLEYKNVLTNAEHQFMYDLTICNFIIFHIDSINLICVFTIFFVHILSIIKSSNLKEFYGKQKRYR